MPSAAANQIRLSIKASTRHLLEINLAVLCISTSGMLGSYIALPPGPTIWWRCALAIGLLYGYCRYRGLNLRLPAGKSRWLIVLSGVLLAAHWVLYFYALQLAGVAVGMLSIYTFPAMTALLAPFLLGTPLRNYHLLLGLLVIGGVYFLTPDDLSLANERFIGLLAGLVSAFIYALRNILMKQQIGKMDGSALMLWQVGITLIVLLPFLYQSPGWPPAATWPYLIVLAVMVTTIGHTLFLRSLGNFDVTTASLLSSVQPVYGILLAMAFFGEIPTAASVIGGVLILAAVVVETLMVRRSAKNPN